MPQPQLTVHRHDRRTRALITPVGEIDLESAPLLQASLEQCLRNGIRAIDIDLAHVTFCDCSGLNAFLLAAQQTTAVGGTLRLHHPQPTLARMLDITGTSETLMAVPPRGSVRLVPVLSGDAR
ncbi:STAS domain-containing protein [Streptomyces sp. SID12501]|uniref:Anti-sigma factor antagonist n=1 Tax=Streptomyces sp. SID12501 TaxID=2706042 RepID=A0A6B3BPJ1_9ACTN|nr:STAS domain-containing protein [Streptomyces sp. SID12501]NEC86230.1 STAS domain-containing protein [Streptomyces sp. SID12501]